MKQEPIALGYRLFLPSLAHRPQALSAHCHAAGFAANHHLGPLHIEVPAALGVAHRVADIVPKLGLSAANLTLGHGNTSLRK